MNNGTLTTQSSFIYYSDTSSGESIGISLDGDAVRSKNQELRFGPTINGKQSAAVLAILKVLNTQSRKTQN
jgi:hypothetical protein